MTQRLSKDTEIAVEQSGNQQELKRFWLEKDTQEPPILKGRSRHVNQLKSFAEKAAENNLPVLLIGAKGTGKLALSRYIYLKSKRKHDGFTTVDCSSIQQNYNGQEGKVQGTNEITLGISQESTLFGHLMGSQSFSNTKRLGYIEVAEGGTIVVKNVEKLTSSTQNKLLIYLKTGFYKRIGSNERIKSNVKIIFTCGENIEELVEAGHLSKELYNFLLRQSIVLIPLRERRRDIPQLVVHFIVKYSKIEGIRPIGITKEAMNILVDYNWPNNIDQLEDVIYRAVRFSEGNTLTASHMFLDHTLTKETGTSFNLLRLKPIRRFILGKIFPNAFRTAAATIYLLIILVLLFGFNGYEKNTVLLVWAIGWPALIISLFFTSRFFCGLCPFRTIAEIIQKRWNIKLKLSDFIKRQGPYIGVFGFVLILCAEQILDMPNSPLATAGLLLSILGFAVIFSILYDRASWCRYVCPLGMMGGVYSKISIFEIRANISVCNTECSHQACYNGTNEHKGCPMHLRVFNMHTNENCILCGQCIKNCKHQAINFNLRIPAAELLRDSSLESYTKGSNFAIAFLIPVLIAGVLTINFRKLFLYHQFDTKISNEVINYTFTYIFFYLLCFGLIWIGSKTLKGYNSEGSSLERLVWYTCTFIPISFAGEIANNIITFINGFSQILPIVNLQFSTYTLRILNQQSSTGTVKSLQAIIIITGTIASMYIGKKVVKKITKSQEGNAIWSIYLVNSVFCGLLMIVFLLMP